LTLDLPGLTGGALEPEGRLGRGRPAGHGRRLICDRVWPAGSGARVARATAGPPAPGSTWALLATRGAWPGSVRRLLGQGRARQLAGGDVVAWRLEHDPVLAGVDDPLDEAARGPGRAGGARGAIVAYKPLRRVVVHFAARQGGGRFVKHVRPGHARALADRHSLVARWARTAADLSVPDLVGYGSAPDFLVWRGVPGVTLEAALRGSDPGGTIAAAARCVASLHLCPSALPRQRSRAAELDATASWISIAPPGLFGGDLLHSTLADLAALGGRIPTARPVLSHGDLHDGQLLFSGHTTWLLDVDTLTLAEPELDLGNLLAHLDLLRLRRPELAPLRLDERLVEAYARSRGRRPDAGRLAWYRALAALRLSCVHAPRPRTRRHASALAAWSRRLTPEFRANREELAS